MSVFLDFFNAFDGVWEKGLIFKLSQNDIFSDLLDILSDFLRDRKQRVVLRSQKSKCQRRRSQRFNFGTIVVLNLYE